MINIKIPNFIQNNIFNHAVKEYPKECCGFLIGYSQNNSLICEDYLSTKNVAANPYKFFEIAPQEIINIQKLYRKKDLSIIGHYHSHPDSLLGSKPSKNDIASIYDTDLCWVIIGITNNSAKLSAYVPKINQQNNYHLKEININ